jgi:DNA-binding PadR family transcriptional regulator
MARRGDPAGTTHETLSGPPLLVLTSLAAGPKHGHALMKDIDAFAHVRLGPGTLYGALARLEERGLIAALPADDRRRPYEITADGEAVLDASVTDLGRVVTAGLSRLRSLRGERGALPRPAIQGGAP